MKLQVHLSAESIKILDSYFIVISNGTDVDLSNNPILEDILNAYIDEKLSEANKKNMPDKSIA